MFKSAKDIHENSPWQELTPGAEIYEPATSKLVMTGEWRVETPDWESLGGTVYETKAGGYAGYVHVSVVLDAEGKILDVTVGQHNESEGYGEKAIDVIPGLIVERQSLGVDAVSGATYTSEAIIKATAKAITAAGLDPADYGFAP